MCCIQTPPSRGLSFWGTLYSCQAQGNCFEIRYGPFSIGSSQQQVPPCPRSAGAHHSCTTNGIRTTVSSPNGRSPARCCRGFHSASFISTGCHLSEGSRHCRSEFKRRHPVPDQRHQHLPSLSWSGRKDQGLIAGKPIGIALGTRHKTNKRPPHQSETGPD